MANDLTTSLVATTPVEMAHNQASLIEWCDQKIAAEQRELADLQENCDIATRNKWRTSSWKSRMARTRRKILFFEKIRKALEVGYYIVPPFPVQAFAIRTDARSPKPGHTTWANDRHQQSARRLPIGEGEYVSPVPEVWWRMITQKDREGNPKEVQQYYAKTFQSVDFPFSLVKPQVLEATSRAMALKLFDQMGVLPQFQAGGDPIVVGQILHPNSYGTPMTFFVAWWMNIDDF